jgi:hypothetical protein
MAIQEQARRSLVERTRKFTPNEAMLRAVTSRLTEDLKRVMVNSNDGLPFRRAIRDIFITPILADAVRTFGTNIAARGFLYSTEGDTKILHSPQIGLVSAMHCAGLDTILTSGTDRPGKQSVSVYSVVNEKMTEAAIGGFCALMLNAYRCAEHQTEYDRRIIRPVIAVYDLSQLLPSVDGKGSGLPEDPIKRAEVILAIYPFDISALLPSRFLSR